MGEGEKRQVLPRTNSRIRCALGPREVEDVIYAEVVRCARQEIEMTKADDLAELLGDAGVSTTVGALQRLETKGRIRIMRYQRSRRVYVVELDKWTAEPANQVPHWRDVPRPSSLPTVSIQTLAEKRKDVAMQIHAEIRRIGAMPAEFICGLIHIGWHEYLADRRDKELAEAACS